MFRGREMAYTEAQKSRLIEVAEALADVAQIDVMPKMEGRTMSMMLNPKKGASSKEKGDGKKPAKG